MRSIVDAGAPESSGEDAPPGRQPPPGADRAQIHEPPAGAPHLADKSLTNLECNVGTGAPRLNTPNYPVIFLKTITAMFHARVGESTGAAEDAAN